MNTLHARISVLALALTLGAGAAVAAEPVGGKLQGKIGDELSTAKWGLQVLSVERRAGYESQVAAEKSTTEPKNAADEVVVIKCRLSNRTQAAQTPMLSPIHPHNTALTDTHGKSYPLLGFDKEGDHTDEGVTLAPGEGTTFAVLFSVPKGTVLGDLVFSLQTAYDDYPDGGVDVRVALGK